MRKIRSLAARVALRIDFDVFFLLHLSDGELLISNAKSINLQKINFVVKSTGNTLIDGWIGSLLRNNLLYSAWQVKIDNTTLLEKINTF